jgi:hypothetical protein
MDKPSARELLDRNVSAAYVQQAAESMQALASRVEKALALHRPSVNVDRPTGLHWCVGCFDEDGNCAWWPCPTVRLLNGEEKMSDLRCSACGELLHLCQGHDDGSCTECECKAQEIAALKAKLAEARQQTQDMIFERDQLLDEKQRAEAKGR